MKRGIFKKEDLHKYRMGVDLAYRLNWWFRFLIWIGILKRNELQDYSCSTVFKDNGDGTFEVVDINLFKTPLKD